MMHLHHDSIPEMVMATGTIAPFDPYHARQDVQPDHVAYVTRVPVGLPMNAAQYSPPPAALTPGSPEFPVSMFGAGDIELLGYGFGAGPDMETVKSYAFGTLGGLALGLLAGALMGYPGERMKSAAKYGAVGAGSGVVATVIARNK